MKKETTQQSANTPKQGEEFFPSAGISNDYVPTPRIETVATGDFSRLPLHISHHEYNPEIDDVAEDLFIALKLPKRSNGNCGRYMLCLCWQEAAKLLSPYNLLNRKVIETRLHAHITALIEGTFIEGWLDPLIFDWNSQMISGQKRLIALIIVGDRLHPRYGGHVWFAVEYGVDPERRSITDNGQERKASDCVPFLADAKSNGQLHSILKVMHTLNSGEPAGTLNGNVVVMKKLFGMHRAALRWAAEQRPIIKVCNTVPGRLALAEMYMLNPKKAEAAAMYLYQGQGNIKQLAALSARYTQCRKNQKPPFGSTGGGSREKEAYRNTVVYLSAFLQDREITSGEPSKGLIEAGWGKYQPVIDDKYKAALNGPVPVIETITDVRKIKSAHSNTPHGRAVHTCNQGGCANPSHAFSAIGLLRPDMDYRGKVEMVLSNVVEWNHCIRRGMVIYRKQKKDKCLIQPSVFVAFLYRFYTVAGCYEYLENNVELLLSGLYFAGARTEKKMPLKGTFAYVCAAFNAARKQKSCPAYTEVSRLQVA